MSTNVEVLRERAYGHTEIWKCTLEEFGNKMAPVLLEHIEKNKLERKVYETAVSFLRIKFDRGELKGTVEYEVSTAIEESMIYYTNCLGE